MDEERTVINEGKSWRDFAAPAVVLLVGLLVGFTIVNRTVHAESQGPGVSQERYALLLSTLFIEGESLSTVKTLTAALDKNSPSYFLTQLADRLEKSGDRAKQRQAEDLRKLAQALTSGIDMAAAPAPASPSPSSRGSAPGQPGSASSESQSSPTASATTGVIKSTPGEGVRLRVEPTTASPALGLLANGTRVEILNVVEGQVVEKNEKRWYKVRSQSTVGYVYSTFVTPNE